MRPTQLLTFLLATLALSRCHGFSLSNTGTAKASRFLAPALSTPNLAKISSPTALRQSVTSVSGGETALSRYERVDWAALVKYPVGVAVQMSLIFGFLTGVDKLVAKYALKVPLAVNFFFLYAFNLKSSLFSILPNKKSDGLKLKQEAWEYNNRNKPSWTPPGIAFAIGWPLLTFGLRAFTAAMIVKSMGGRYATPAIMSLMLHLCSASLWNTVNNVERRLGVSVILLYGMWATKAFAAFQFYKIEPMAGKLLAATLTWITAACALETRTWQINPDPDTGKREPLVPMQHPKWKTKFRWEQ